MPSKINVLTVSLTVHIPIDPANAKSRETSGRAAEQLIALLPDWPEELIEFEEFSYSSLSQAGNDGMREFYYKRHPDEPRTVEEVKQRCREIHSCIESGEIESKYMAIMRSLPVPCLLGISNQKNQ